MIHASIAALAFTVAMTGGGQITKPAPCPAGTVQTPHYLKPPNNNGKGPSYYTCDKVSTTSAKKKATPSPRTM